LTIKVSRTWECANENLFIYVTLIAVFRTYLSKWIVLETLIVNNFLIKDVQTKNRIVWKCANENLSSGVLSNENFLNLR